MKSPLSLICLLTALALGLSGCKKKEEVVEAEAAKALTEAAKALSGGGEAGKGAGEMGRAAGEMGKALGEMGKALAGAGGKPKGDVINWRKLAPLLPEKLGDFAADGELQGSTNSMGAMKVSEVKRRYKAGDKRLRAKITDAWLVPMLRAPFALAQAVNQDSTSGIQKGVKVGGHPAILKWRKSGKRGRLTIMVAGRFLTELRLRPTEDPEEVVKLAKTLDLDALAKFKAK